MAQNYNPYSIVGDFDTFSPNREYAVRMYDYCQINPPQSTDIIIRYKFEIVKEKCMGESGMQFEEGYLDLFPSVFPNLDNGPLGQYRAYVNLTTQQRSSADFEAYRRRFWHWSDDSRYLTIFLNSLNFGVPNKIVVFDVVGRRYKDQDFKGIPDEESLRQVGYELIAKFPTPSVSANQNNMAAEEETVKPKTRLVRVEDKNYELNHKPIKPKAPVERKLDFKPPQVPTEKVSSPQANGQSQQTLVQRYVSQPEAAQRLARIFWSIYIPAMALVFAALAFLLTMPANMGASSRWLLIGAVSVIGTLICTLIEMRKHAKVNNRLINYISMGDVVGRDLQDFIRVLGKPSAVMPCTITDQNNASGRLVTWAGYRYQIIILFDMRNKCICIKHELLPDLY